MPTVLEFLCILFDCGEDALLDKLLSEKNRERADALLCGRPLMCNYGSFQRVQYGGLSHLPACRLFAFNGYLGVTVTQFYYVKHNKKLRNSHFPCVMVRKGNNQIDYFPIELMLVE